MLNKKIAALLAVSAIITTTGSISAFAATATVCNPTCTISSCTQTGEHKHDGKSYAAHTADDGHTYHANCGVSDCTQSGSHQHDGNHNGGRHHNGGHKRGGHH